MFLEEIFVIKPSRFQSIGIFSRNTRFPGLGAFGCISSAGVARISYSAMAAAAPIVHRKATPTPSATAPHGITVIRAGIE